ncbi:hypothetical protein CR203_07495 [Salipaludibacillus neizhouensis]|uniref:Membrane protein NfeD2 N-terminal transmembrane domain-containing protein n=1 Tax=Salipaludibacillus neizhouensis TaxID=885475 RepID=A0A3A9KUP1_9BACI|nr:hypothetical protein [Salipaludibacillus neizhouensis]RKL68316.1 hypothetical protein CR203_07495 [Salipaludibacillus neizhouensis]
MEVFGFPIETLYLYALILGVILTVLFLFVGDLLEGLFNISGDGVINPITLIGYITLFGGLGYVLETVTFMNSGTIIVINAVISLIVIVLVNFFIVIPVKRSEKNISYSVQELKGTIGEVYTTIPIDGFGEIVIPRTHGTMSKPAKSFDGDHLPEGTKILVIDIDDEGVFLVSKHYE